MITQYPWAHKTEMNPLSFLRETLWGSGKGRPGGCLSTLKHVALSSRREKKRFGLRGPVIRCPSKPTASVPTKQSVQTKKIRGPWLCCGVRRIDTKDTSNIVLCVRVRNTCFDARAAHTPETDRESQDCTRLTRVLLEKQKKQDRCGSTLRLFRHLENPLHEDITILGEPEP